MIEKTLKNLSVDSKANVYFDGRVSSRSCYKEDGTRFTLGVITPGTYTFSVGDREIVRLIAGTAEILLPTEKEWRRVSAPDSFEVIANSNYNIRCYEVVEYLCDYYKN
ncbi:pyrimidine/purine nucleoside phosphorylase [Sporomusa aerivorans]|uniref:pyrimidine/purine nucleoside phosphorylase n=1 Tax=Sporomusa aerivorans TaxID=204936 RepID=UPI00352A1C31